MASQLDDLLAQLTPDYRNAAAVCTAISNAVRDNPAATRMWPMLIESRMKQHKMPPAIGRALMDAAQVFDSEKTMWLSGAGNPVNVPSPLPTPTTQAASEPPEVAAADHQAATAQVTAPTAANLYARPNVAAALLQPGAGSLVNNRYLLDKQLGYGCMGQVFTAVDMAAESSGASNANVTLEVVAVDLQQEPKALSALKVAVARTKGLRHANIVRVYGVEQAEDQVSVVMEPLAGRWLGDLIREAKNTGLSPAIAWPLIAGIATGLAHAHPLGIVHANLNPCSVFITDAGTPKIMGFELIDALPTSQAAMALLDTMTLRAYSEAYAADASLPQSKAHPADDLYALGVIAYELLTGRHPFQRCSRAIAQQKHLVYTPIANISPRAAELIAQCLCFERARRPENALQFLKRMQGPVLLRWLFGDKYSVMGEHRRALERQ